MEVVNTVGRRKAAVARVYVKPGKGQITINRKALEVYFPLEILQYQVKQPLLATNTAENYDIVINLDGGGCWQCAFFLLDFFQSSQRVKVGRNGL